MMHMEQRMVQTQTMRLMLTQKMQQAIQILQLSHLELQEYVQQELDANPVLEQLQVEPDHLERASSSDSDSSAQVQDGNLEYDDYMGQWDMRLHEGKDLSYNPEIAQRRDFYENSITKEESLVSHLMTQLQFAFEDQKLLAIGECIIGDMDGKGYFVGSLEEIAESNGVEVSQVERVLYRIQRFEPTGVGARDVVECLLLQIAAEFPNEPQLSELVEFHLVELEHRQIPAIAKAMKVAPERIEKLQAMLAQLNPWPGYEYNVAPPHYIAADVIVEKIDGEYVVYLPDGLAPKITINDEYRDLAKNGGVKKDEKKYITEKLEAAKWLIRNIEQRQQTILRIGTAIVEVQREFLEKGVEAIRPLTLQEIADMVGVHEATVSRTTRGKYMQTPQGLFELKYFFSPGLKSDTGEDQSSKSVQNMIKKIVEEENKAKPLSDQKIANMLKEEGINIARRTVSKYREGLNIPATTMRKSYT